MRRLRCLRSRPARLEMSNDFNFGMDKTKAAYITHNQAFPFLYAIDDKALPKVACGQCVEACKYDAIDLDMKPETINVNVGSVVLATGWDPYDISKLDNLGGGKVANVIYNMQMERLASPNGPTGGKILRPSDGKRSKNIAFVQCAGSRDENHLPYCSYICCMASIEAGNLYQGAVSGFKGQIFYIDMRTPGTIRAVLLEGQGRSECFFHQRERCAGSQKILRPRM